MSAEPADADGLYALPLAEFTAARNALAKQLVRDGDKAGAAEVKRLPKPSRTAWALNQLARGRPGDVEELIAAGRRLREAQQRALDGDAGDLREATRAEHAQVGRLLDLALALLGEGAGGAERLRATLHAAATGSEAAELLRRGRLVADIEASGFGLEGLAELDRRPRPPRSEEHRPATPVDAGGDGRPSEDEAGRRAREAAEAEAEAAERAHRRARKEADREAERLRREAERTRERAHRLLEEAERLERQARQARGEAETAADAAAEAEQRAVEASGRLEALDRRPPRQ